MKMYHLIFLSKSNYLEKSQSIGWKSIQFWVPSLQAICPVLPLKGRLNWLKVIDFAFFRVFDITCLNEECKTVFHEHYRLDTQYSVDINWLIPEYKYTRMA